MTTREYLELDKEKDRDEVCRFNRELVERHPYLLPRNRFSGEMVAGYDWSWTEMDLMPKGWRLAFGNEMLDRITEALKEADCLEQYRIADIKEKYGGLRWYDFGAPEKVCEIIKHYGQLSQRTCIFCGCRAEWVSKNGLILPYCDECAKKSGHVFPGSFKEIKETDDEKT